MIDPIIESPAASVALNHGTPGRSAAPAPTTSTATDSVATVSRQRGGGGTTQAASEATNTFHTSMMKPAFHGATLNRYGAVGIAAATTVLFGLIVALIQKSVDNKHLDKAVTNQRNQDLQAVSDAMNYAGGAGLLGGAATAAPTRPIGYAPQPYAAQAPAYSPYAAPGLA